MRFLLQRRVLAGVLLTVVAMAQSEPEMSGVWQLNKQRSNVESSMAWARVGLTGTTFSVLMRTFKPDGKEEAFDWQFKLDSSESSNLMHGAPMKSHVVREGDALVVRTVTMFGPDALKTVDRWTLSEEGKTLTLEEKHRFRDEPEGTSVFVFERRPASEWPAAQAAKPAEESYKNIRILKGLPAERLPIIMASFAGSLGVTCGHCHVPGDFANDSKPAKQTARKMWNMVAAVNRDSFSGAETVTCWTCHRGSVKPESQQPK
jgi:hypothetical protein